MVYEHYPLRGHQYAFGAAVAVECARLQGEFEAYHKLLFVNQGRLRELSYTRLAKKAEVANIPAFTSCVEDEQTGSIVISGLNLAQKLGISAIPTFLVNGKLVTGALNKQQLSALVEEALAAQ